MKLISVHVPKTGGASFLSLLESTYGDRLLRDYTDKPMAEGTVPRVFRALKGSVTAPQAVQSYDCVHGHFLPVKYRRVKNASFAIWFRDPVERLVSRYYYWNRKFEPDNPQFRKYIKHKDISLEDFVRIPHYHNIYDKYLFGMRLSDFDFVGITENYAASLACFKKVYGIEADTALTLGNINPHRGGDSYDLPPGLRDELRAANAKDYRIFDQAKAINDALINRHCR
ncbi:MAG: hypothetical protein ACPGO3_04735 [Magnetospiraceae bacterium]